MLFSASQPSAEDPTFLPPPPALQICRAHTEAWRRLSDALPDLMADLPPMPHRAVRASCSAGPHPPGPACCSLCLQPACPAGLTVSHALAIFSRNRRASGLPFLPCLLPPAGAALGAALGVLRAAGAGAAGAVARALLPTTQSSLLSSCRRPARRRNMGAAAGGAAAGARPGAAAVAAAAATWRSLPRCTSSSSSLCLRPGLLLLLRRHRTSSRPGPLRPPAMASRTCCPTCLCQR